MPAHGAAVEAMSVILEYPEQMRTTDVHEMDPGPEQAHKPIR